MKLDTINRMASAAAEQALRVIDEKPAWEHAELKVRLAGLIADVIELTTKRERRNDRRRVARTRA